jgi:hypothetical protein
MICWRQGFGWWVIKYPYKTKKDTYFTRQKPAGAYDVKGSGSAYKTIQALGGDPDVVVSINLGIFDVSVTGRSLQYKRKSNTIRRKSRNNPASLKSIRR